MIHSLLDKNARVLVVAAHPDDEVLGCGGTIRRATKAGAEVSVLFLTNGVGARCDSDETAASNRQKNACEALAILGVDNVEFLEYPDNQLDQVPLLEIIKAVEKIIRGFCPSIVLTHHGGDLNIDHRMVSEAVTVACRPLPGRNVQIVLSFEVPSSTEWVVSGVGSPFDPCLFVDVTNELADKISALKCYEEEMRAFPHSRSLEAVEFLGKWRGACAGVVAAEAFSVLRMII